MRNAFVVGCPRSGTSWVRNILGRHPDVHCGPESHLFPLAHEVVRSANGRVRWADVLSRYDAFAHRVGPQRWIDRATLAGLIDQAAGSTGDPRDVADDLIAAVFTHYATRHRLGAGTMLVEKTPSHLFYAERILGRFPEARIVEVRRDGRDVCVSLERRARRADWPPRERAEQIRLWTTAVREGLRVSADPAHSSSWHIVRYEDLIADRHGEIARMFGFLGLDANRDVVDDVVAATDISGVAQAGDGEHVRKGAVGDWRNYFTDVDVALFHELADDVFQAAGYAY